MEENCGGSDNMCAEKRVCVDCEKKNIGRT
jgi:hypothetical protein